MTDSGATIYEVAQRAGVSIATVSRTLRGTGPVAAETRKRVLAAVRELRFTPSRLGVSLAEGRHAANGIVFPDLSGPYYAEVVIGYEEVVSELGRSVIILSTRGRTAVGELVKELAARVDGLVVFGHTVDDSLVADLVAQRLPVVLLARKPLAGTDSVVTENVRSAMALTEHLLGHGYRRFALVGDDESGDVAERWQGVREALRAHAITPQQPIRCPFTVAGGLQAGLDLLTEPHPGVPGPTRRPRPEAVICADDQLALGVLLAAERLGLRVPGEVAVVGWDDIMAARHSRPALTTVRQPMRELGARAAMALDELITRERHEPRHLTLPTELVVRASCGPH